MTKLTIGTWTVTFLVGNEPELLNKAILSTYTVVGLAKTNCTISGTKVLKRGWTGGGLFLVFKYLPVCRSSFWWGKGYQTVVLLHLWVREQVLTVLAYEDPLFWSFWEGY